MLKGLASSAVCALCLGDMETSLHVVRDCPQAAKVWLALIPQHLITTFFSLPLPQRVDWNLEEEGLSLYYPHWGSVLLFVVGYCGCGGMIVFSFMITYLLRSG